MDQPDSTATPPRKGEFARNWRSLFACTVGIGCGLSPIPPFMSGLFGTALQDEFGWSRGDVLAPIMFVTAALLLLGPVIGRLADKHGARPIALLSTAGLGISLAAMSLVSEQIWTYYACWAVLAVVAIGTLPITYAKVITRAFDKHRGFALGIALASTGVAGALAQFYVQWLIEEWGWRVAFVGLGAVPLLVAWPILFVFLRDASPSGEASGKAAQPANSMNLHQAMRTHRFWLLSLSALAFGCATGGLIPNFVPLLTEGGTTTLDEALQAMSLLAISVIVGRLVTGFMLDRVPGPLVTALLAAPAIITLALVFSLPLVPPLAMACAIAIGLVAGAEFDLVAYMTSRYFGRAHFSTIYGIQYAIFGLGSGVSPAAFGWLRDVSEDSSPLVLASLCLFAFAVLSMAFLGRYPDEHKPVAAL